MTKAGEDSVDQASSHRDLERRCTGHKDDAAIGRRERIGARRIDPLVATNDRRGPD